MISRQAKTVSSAARNYALSGAGAAYEHPGSDASLSAALKVGEVARVLRCHPSTVYRLLRRGELRGFKLGSDWRFLRSEVERFMREASEGARGPSADRA